MLSMFSTVSHLIEGILFSLTLQYSLDPVNLVGPTIPRLVSLHFVDLQFGKIRKFLSAIFCFFGNSFAFLIINIVVVALLKRLV